VLRRVGLDLAPIQRDPPEVRRAHFTGQAQHLLEEATQRRQVPLSKVSDRAEIWLVAGRQHAKSHVFGQPALDSPRREDPDAVRRRPTLSSA
jgi:hypothetical protein